MVVPSNVVESMGLGGMMGAAALRGQQTMPASYTQPVSPAV